ncbi:MAG: HD domain-containing protein [Desulfuromonadales bacterium]|nr:HD domain-containing protein [Desulfuromonadales bacterium]
MDTHRPYNSRIIDTYLKFLHERYPLDTESLLDHAGMAVYEVADQGHWFSQEQVDLFYNKCVELTGDKNIAREAGRFAAKPGTLGAMRQYMLGLAGPLKSFSLISATTKKFTRSSRYSFHKISSNKVEVTATPYPEFEEKPFQCENRIGFFEAIVNIFNLGTPQIDHPECMFRGGTRCRYIISWPHNLSLQITRVRNLTLACGSMATLFGLLFDPALALSTILPFSAISYLGIGWMSAHLHTKTLSRDIEQLWDSSEQLAEQIDLNYRNTKLAADVGDVIANRTSIEEVCESVVHILQNTLDFDRGLILLANQERTRLEIRGAYGYQEQHLDILTNLSFSLDKPDSRGMFVSSFREQRPILVNDIEKIKDSLSQKSLDFAQALGTQSFICVPISLEGKSIGILAVDNLKTKKPLLKSDVNLLMGISPAIAVSIQNARLLEARTAQFESTLQVLADSIDARDFLTAGHSEKVAEYAVGVAEELGLNEQECRVIRMAALLHDYGKIAIPDSILKKAGPLTPEEREVIRTHPTKTRQILEKVAFEGPYRMIPAICQSHHERWDGEGYPNALKGEEIPLASRIIAVADFFEAITAKRHYRAPMETSVALETFLSESGKSFQPEIADAFVRYLDNHIFSLRTSHKPVNTVINNRWRTEPRQFRVPYRTEVSIRAEQKVITGTSFNISQGGLFVSSDEATKLKPAAGIQITFTIPEKHTLIQVPAKVVWINGENKVARHLPQGFGIQFSETPPELEQTVERYRNNYLAHGSRMTH